MSKHLKLHVKILRLLRESFRVDARLTPDYERGWNDAVAWLNGQYDAIYRKVETGDGTTV